MKKFFIGVVLSVLFVANSAFAMTFSQPVKIGEFGWSQVGGGFVFTNATENNGDIRTTRGNRKQYGKGTARFGNSNDSLYVHYNSYQKSFTVVKFGANDVSNTVNFDISVLDYRIFSISNSDRGNFYLLSGGYDLLENDRIIFLGRKSDGTWVKYFDTENLLKKYFGQQQLGYWFNGFKVHDNAISINYRRNFDGRAMSRDYADEYGEFRFKWDDNAQWFSVEQIKY